VVKKPEKLNVAFGYATIENDSSEVVKELHTLGETHR